MTTFGISDLDPPIGARKPWHPAGVLPAIARPTTMEDRRGRFKPLPDDGCYWSKSCFCCKRPDCQYKPRGR